MNTKLKLACTGLVVVGLGLASAGIQITTNTMVTDADVANYLAADIDIAAGATLCFSGLTTAPTFTGSLTGGGNFVVVSATAPANATAAEKTRVTFNGTATGFSGKFFVTNHLVTVSGPTAIGSAKFTQKNIVASTKSYFNGAGTYAGDFDLWTCDTHPWGIVFAQGVMVTGAILWRGGRLCGPGTIAGPVTIESGKILYGQDSVHFAGGIHVQAAGSGTLQSDSGVFYLDAPVQRVSNIASIKQVIHFGCENALDPAQSLSIGAGYGKYGAWNLHGFNQRCGTISCANTGDNEGATYFTSDGPATLTINNQTSDTTLYGNFKGQLSFDYASSSGKKFTLAGGANDMTGRITVRSGTVAITAKTVFTALSGLDLLGTGQFEIPAGMIFEIDSVRVDGTALAPGAYTKDSSEVAGRLSGAGTLIVRNAAAKTEGATSVWVGGTDGDSIRAAANWQGGVAPRFDGTERLVFGAGTATAVVSGTINAFAIDIVQKDAFTLAAADADAKIVLEQGGLNITNAVDMTIVTHVVSCPIELGYLPQTWSVSTNASFNNAAPIIGRLAASPLIIRSWGHTRFNADNSSLVTPLVLTNCSTAGQPWIYNMKGLGSPTRATTIHGCVPRFDTSTAGAYTNEVPLRIRSNLTNQEGDMVDSSGTGSLHLTGKVTYFGAITGELYSRGPVYFHGGLESESGNELTLRITQPSVWIDGQPIRTAGTLATDYGGSWLELAVAGNTWKTLGIKKTTVRCQVANALDPAGTLNIGGGSVYYHKPMGTIDLNGFDQTSARMTMAWNPRDTYNNYDWAGAYALVTSTNGGPAKLTLSGTTKDVMSVKFGGQAGLRYAGTGEMTLTNVVSESAGTLSVASGVLRIAAGAGWANAAEVAVSGTGRLAVAPNAGAKAFGPQSGKSESVMRISDSGVVEVAAGETATVMNLILVDGNGKETYVNSGEYGGPDAGLSAGHTLSCLAGTGRLYVRLNPFQGTMLILR